MTCKLLGFALAMVACASVRSKADPPPVAAAPVAAEPVAVAAPPAAEPVADEPPPLVVPPPAVQPLAADNAWLRLQAYLPVLAGLDHEHEFHLVGAYAASLDANAYWTALADDLTTAHGGLARTCAARVEHFLALVIDDPTTTQAIGRPGPDVRVFWMPLAHVAQMTVQDAIHAAGLVDGPGAAKVVRELRRGRTAAMWVDAVERSEAWFLSAGDDPTINHRRIRGYAVATLPALRSRLVYVGINVLGNFCEIATAPLERLDGLVVGAIHSGADVVCDLAGVRDLAECRR